MHQCFIKSHLHDIKDKGKENKMFDSLKQPDVNALNVLPASEGSETCECHQANESIDFYARALWPVLVEDSVVTYITKT